MAALSGTLSACQSDPSNTAASGAVPHNAPVLQPGRPGEPNVEMTGPMASSPSAQAVDPDDARFMAEMIGHHAQALQMVALAKDGITDPQVAAIAGRIDAAQRPEIAAMARWLTQYGQSVPPEATYPLMSEHTAHQGMPGMATTAQMESLAQAEGVAADRLFLTLMIAHHQGAMVMALEQRKHGSEDRATEMSDDISVTQSAEIGHLTGMLTRLGG